MIRATPPRYSGLSEAEWRIADQSTGEAAAYQRAAAAAEKAIALAPDSPEGYWARGQLRVNYFFDWTGAQADYEHALALDPNYARALVAEGGLLATLRRMPEGIVSMRRAIAIDPMSVGAWRGLLLLLTNAEQLPSARDALKRLREVDPQGEYQGATGILELLQGHAREALDVFQSDHSDYRYCRHRDGGAHARAFRRVPARARTRSSGNMPTSWPTRSRRSMRGEEKTAGPLIGSSVPTVSATAGLPT